MEAGAIWFSGSWAPRHSCMLWKSCRLDLAEGEKRGELQLGPEGRGVLGLFSKWLDLVEAMAGSTERPAL